MSENQQSPLDWLSSALKQLEEQGLSRQRRVRSGPQQPKVTFAGRSVTHFGSNDYLDLANDPRIVHAVCTAVERDGWGAAASPLISGHTEQHAAFAEALARFERTDAAVLFGSGFAAAGKRGSENNDPFTIKDGKIATVTNNAGGILGGISNGMPIVLRVAIKPTPSIAISQETVDLKKRQNAKLEIRGRHDTCLVPRAVPVVSAMIAVTLSDFALRAGLIPEVIK